MTARERYKMVKIIENNLLACYRKSNAVMAGLLGHYMLSAIKKERDPPSTISTHRYLHACLILKDPKYYARSPHFV